MVGTMRIGFEVGVAGRVKRRSPELIGRQDGEPKPMTDYSKGK
jgi:hypothetical protein